ncbi:demethylpremithracinone o-methyltransferase [Streptomyces sp. NRRL F-5630]|uniref:demethylpremithracinone o-methyltransferase n=1 Tax=Streptomyces sp. NRRL F-5630 TaxID=1463864 RepID=UPI0004CBA710|nr:demethylpremithracinone o-methyltransferase [Streptomyces sp. NRRL F-5630]
MTNATPEAPSLAEAREVLQLNVAYTRARVLHTALELGLFEFLAAGPRTEAEIREYAELHSHLVSDWLEALVGLGLLTFDGGGYANASRADHFLVPGRPHYIGGAVLQHGRVHYELWNRFADALRDGKATSGRNITAGAVVEEQPDLDRARRFLDHMDTFNQFVAAQLSHVLDWSRWTTFVDVGGARGNVAARLVLDHPNLKGSVFDVPGVEPLFDEHMAARGTTDRVGFVGGDFFNDPLPGADVILFGHVLHDHPEESRKKLLAQAFDALPPGGMLLVYDAMLDESSEPGAYLQSLVCSVILDGGSEYRVRDISAWAEEIGYEVEQVIPLDTMTHDRLLVARKPG